MYAQHQSSCCGAQAKQQSYAQYEPFVKKAACDHIRGIPSQNIPHRVPFAPKPYLYHQDSPKVFNNNFENVSERFVPSGYKSFAQPRLRPSADSLLGQPRSCPLSTNGTDQGAICHSQPLPFSSLAQQRCRPSCREAPDYWQSQNHCDLRFFQPTCEPFYCTFCHPCYFTQRPLESFQGASCHPSPLLPPPSPNQPPSLACPVGAIPAPAAICCLNVSRPIQHVYIKSRTFYNSNRYRDTSSSANLPNYQTTSKSSRSQTADTIGRISPKDSILDSPLVCSVNLEEISTLPCQEIPFPEVEPAVPVAGSLLNIFSENVPSQPNKKTTFYLHNATSTSDLTDCTSSKHSFHHATTSTTDPSSVVTVTMINAATNTEDELFFFKKNSDNSTTTDIDKCPYPTQQQSLDLFAKYGASFKKGNRASFYSLVSALRAINARLLTKSQLTQLYQTYTSAFDENLKLHTIRGLFSS